MPKGEPYLTKDRDLCVLVLDPGGRGHAIVRELLRTDEIACLHTSIAAARQDQGGEKVRIFKYDAHNPAGQAVDMTKASNVDFVIFGSEGPLAEGGVNQLMRIGIPAVGPIQEHAWLEGDKAKAKDFMKRWGIPIANYRVFFDHTAALRYVRSRKEPLVVKAAYLAAGKGSIVCDDTNEAEKALHDLMILALHEGAGKEKVVIEDRLFGTEQSVTAFTDGKTVLLAPTARDYKRRFDGNLGSNTGGMGSHSPSGNEDIFDQRKVLERIIYPALEGIVSETKEPYKGVLYPGLMWVRESGEWNPYVLEFNIRAGDPEAQVVFPRLEYPDWTQVFLGMINGTLGEIRPRWSSESYLTVCAVSGLVPRGETHGKGKYPGYPGKYKPGQVIAGLDDNGSHSDCGYFLHAGTCLDQRGDFVTSGGRVLSVVGHGANLSAAKARAYQLLARVSFKYMDYRSDIGEEAFRVVPPCVSRESPKPVNSW